MGKFCNSNRKENIFIQHLTHYEFKIAMLKHIRKAEFKSVLDNCFEIPIIYKIT